MYSFYGYDEVQLVHTGLLLVLLVLCFLVYRRCKHREYRVVLTVSGDKHLVDRFPHRYRLIVNKPGEYVIRLDREEIKS